MIWPQKPRQAILIVEDDPQLAAMLRDRFVARGYSVWLAESAGEAELIAEEIRPDLFVLDLMLPDTHGLVLCANLREKHQAPIVICSATKRKDDPVLGFKLGAVDFIAKPFSADELEARVEVALRHWRQTSTHESAAGGVRTLGPLAIDESRREVTLGGKPIHLTPTEFQLLSSLVTRPNTVLSREDLAGAVWGTYDQDIGRSLEVHLRRLRAKLKAGPVKPPALLAARGFGYKLTWDPGP